VANESESTTTGYVGVDEVGSIAAHADARDVVIQTQIRKYGNATRTNMAAGNVRVGSKLEYQKLATQCGAAVA